MPNWKDPVTNERLLAALVASLVAQNAKINYQGLATLMGDGTTYDAIEKRFRIIKKDAAALQAEVDTGIRGPAPLRPGLAGKSSTPSTPSKQRTPRAEKTSKPSQERTRPSRAKKDTTSGSAEKKRKVKHEEDGLDCPVTAPVVDNSSGGYVPTQNDGEVFMVKTSGAAAQTHGNLFAQKLKESDGLFSRAGSSDGSIFDLPNINSGFVGWDTEGGI